jgi:hypothetical protein
MLIGDVCMHATCCVRGVVRCPAPSIGSDVITVCLHRVVGRDVVDAR